MNNLSYLLDCVPTGFTGSIVEYTAPKEVEIDNFHFSSSVYIKVEIELNKQKIATLFTNKHSGMQCDYPFSVNLKESDTLLIRIINKDFVVADAYVNFRERQV